MYIKITTGMQNDFLLTSGSYFRFLDHLVSMAAFLGPSNHHFWLDSDLLEQMCLLLEQCGTGARFQMGMKTT